MGRSLLGCLGEKQGYLERFIFLGIPIFIQHTKEQKMKRALLEVEIKDDLYRDLKLAAKEEGLSIDDMLEVIILKYLNENEYDSLDYENVL